MNDHLEAERAAYLAAFPDLHFRGAWTARNEQDFAVWLAARRASSVPAIPGTGGENDYDQAGEDANNLSVMLWLLRRLPRAYGNPPHVAGPILRLAKRTRTDVAECLAERQAAPSLPLEAKAGEDA